MRGQPAPPAATWQLWQETHTQACGLRGRLVLAFLRLACQVGEGTEQIPGLWGSEGPGPACSCTCRTLASVPGFLCVVRASASLCSQVPPLALQTAILWSPLQPRGALSCCVVHPWEAGSGDRLAQALHSALEPCEQGRVRWTRRETMGFIPLASGTPHPVGVACLETDQKRVT